MDQTAFVPLRIHTAYSLSEGAIRIGELAKRCRDYGMPAAAITDSSNLFGAMEFSKTCAANGIQPIVGCQLILDCGEGDSGKLVLLAKDAIGYGHLMKLVSSAYLNSADPTEPRITLDNIADLADGLILLTGGVDGPIGQYLAQGKADRAEEVLARLSALFGDRLYMEISRQNRDGEQAIESAMIDLAFARDIPLVATNEAFFLDAEMYEAHDALLCIANGTYVGESDRRRSSPDLRLKSPEEMQALFADLPEALANTVVIARRCAFMVESIDPILPRYDSGDGRSEEDELQSQAEQGLRQRLEIAFPSRDHSETERQALTKPYYERLQYELGVIGQMGFPGYFLIVSDFIRWAKRQGIPVGPGRGSGAGSVVAWALAITDLDPLRYGLLFERFLNPERVSMPDFDVDFCQDRRDEVITYVQNKYGHDRVAQIITFGKLQARAVLRDVGRVLEMPFGQVDKICKMVPNNPASPVTLGQALEGEPRLQEMVREDETVSRLFDMGLQLEGLYRHASTHAAGVVIGDRPLDELVPLYRDPRSDMPVTQYNMKFVESAGLVKFDFLGLKTLTVLSHTIALLRGRDIEIDLSNIPTDDPATYAMLARGHSMGVFQLESTGMRDVLRSMKPDSLEDLIAVVALYRPGPMDNIPSYIRRKHGDEPPDYLYPTLEPILRETHGIMIYQEQVMQIAQELSGYTLGAADLLRRAMGKKIQKEMDEQKAVFVSGAEARGVPGRKADDIFEQVAKFANYGFNKSHAAAYALVAYQTAYLKANYPVEFLAASMTLDIHNTDKLNAFRQELERQEIPLLPPDVNRSLVTFGVESTAQGSLAVRYALAAVKTVGEGPMTLLVTERETNGPFKSLEDLADRLDAKALNKRQFENLARVGAFDAIESNRQRVFSAAEAVLRRAVLMNEERNSNQIALFGQDDDAAKPPIRMSQTPDWPMMERLKEEMDALGFYLSAHPMDAYEKTLTRLQVIGVADLIRAGQSGAYRMAGTVIGKKERVSAKGNRFAFVQISDASGTFEVTVFSEILSTHRDVLEPGNNVFMKVSVAFEGDSMRVTVGEVESLDILSARTAAGLNIVLDGSEGLDRLAGLLAQAKSGRGEIRLVLKPEPTLEVPVLLKERFLVSPELLREVQMVPGVREIHEL